MDSNEYEVGPIAHGLLIPRKSERLIKVVLLSPGMESGAGSLARVALTRSIFGWARVATRARLLARLDAPRVISRRDVGWNPRRSFVKTVAFTKLMHASRPAPDLDGKSGKFSTPAAPLISPPRSESPAGIFFKWIYFYRFAPADTVSSFIFCKKEGGVSVSSRVLKEDQESRNGRVSYVCERVNRFNERELEWKWRRGTR